jgi:hypothetical protein
MTTWNDGTGDMREAAVPPYLQSWLSPFAGTVVKWPRDAVARRSTPPAVPAPPAPRAAPASGPAPARSRARPGGRTRKVPAPATKGTPVDAAEVAGWWPPEGPSPAQLLVASAPAAVPGYLQLPHWLCRSGLLGALNRTRANLGTLLVVLLDYADLPDRLVSASPRTLCAHSGIRTRPTLMRHLARLATPWTVEVDGAAVPIPALLVPVQPTRGSRPRWAFHPDGIIALGETAQALVAARAARTARISDARRLAGTRGLTTRWAPR